MVIPRIIHQTWKTKKLLPEFSTWSKTWIQLNPEFFYVFYTDKDCALFILTQYPQYYDLWKSLVGIEKVDVFRYLILHKYGGVYVDMDCECLKPIGPLLDLFETSLITGYEYEEPIQYLQWFIACPKECKIMIELVEEVASRSWYKWFKSWLLTENQLVYWFTGPILYTDVLRETRESLAILDKGKLGCYDTKLIDRNSYLQHHFTGSWKSNKCKPI